MYALCDVWCVAVCVVRCVVCGVRSVVFAYFVYCVVYFVVFAYLWYLRSFVVWGVSV